MSYIFFLNNCFYSNLPTSHLSDRVKGREHVGISTGERQMRDTKKKIKKESLWTQQMIQTYYTNVKLSKKGRLHHDDDCMIKCSLFRCFA